MNTGMTLLFLVFMGLVSSDSSITVNTLGWFIVAIAPIFLILNFTFRKVHAVLVVCWGLCWAVVWLAETFLGVTAVMGIPWISSGKTELQWFLNVIFAAAVINLLSVFILPFYQKMMAYVPVIKIKIGQHE